MVWHYWQLRKAYTNEAELPPLTGNSLPNENLSFLFSYFLGMRLSFLSVTDFTSLSGLIHYHQIFAKVLSVELEIIMGHSPILRPMDSQQPMCLSVCLWTHLSGAVPSLLSAQSHTVSNDGQERPPCGSYMQTDTGHSFVALTSPCIPTHSHLRDHITYIIHQCTRS